MARLSRAEIFDPSEVVAVHVMARTVRHCFLLGDNQRTGKNFDHRKQWFEDKLKQLAAGFENENARSRAHFALRRAGESDDDLDEKSA